MEKIDTIVSLITGQGKSAVSVIRLSGADAFNMLRNLGIDFSLEHHRIYVKDLIYKGKMLDKGVISVFQSPNSYTGENVVEISVHGGSISSKRIISALIESGCRHAERGEFTRRSFLNGKMGLLEAESVLMKVNALTEDVFDSTVDSKSNQFIKHVKSIREKIIDLKSFIQSSIDFPDDIDYDKKRVTKDIDAIIDSIDSLYKKSQKGYVNNNHPLIVLTGCTNTGKSTLFNRILKMERAIVSEEEGTTRDIISEWIDINGHPVKIVDTAGVRETKSFVEKKGMEKLFDILKSASLAVFLFDLEKGFTKEDEITLNKLKNIPVIVAGNKSDKAQTKKEKIKHLRISAITGDGIKDLEDMIILKLHFNERLEITVNERQMHIIERMHAFLLSDDVRKSIEESEILDEKINRIMHDIKELTGEILSEEILDNIFNNFCIGK